MIRPALAALSALCALALPPAITHPGVAHAATALTCSTPSCATQATQEFSYNQATTGWAVVAARSTPQTADVRVCVYRDAGYTQLAACSDVAGTKVVDFVALDYTHTPTGSAYPRTERLTASGETCTHYDCGTLLAPGSSPIMGSWTGSQLVRVFNVPVTAGKVYRLAVIEISGNVDFGVAVMNSAGQAGYATGRSQAAGLADARGAGIGEGLYFEATANDTVGFVVWSNSPGATASYRAEAREAFVLQPNAVSSYPGESQRDFLAVPPPPGGWSVFALRPLAQGVNATDADLRLYTRPDYGTQLLRSSAGPGVVDYMVANYANAPEDTASVLMISLGPLGSYLLEWVNDPPLLETGVVEPLNLAGRVAGGRHVELTAGVEYLFVHEPGAGSRGDAALALFGPRAIAPDFTYGTRIDSVAGSDVWAEGPPGGWVGENGIEQFLFTPTLSGNYLLFFYQKSAHDVVGGLRYYPTSLIGVGPDAGTGLSLAAPAPSPARPGDRVRLRFLLPQAGPARLTLHDARGRRVATVVEGDLPAGPGERTWDGRRAGGTPAPGGVYFARLEAGGEVRAQRFLWLP